MKLKHHYILMGITLIVAALCGVLMFFVHVNSDMTKYLPNGSPMKQGYAIILNEFGEANISSADVKAMTGALSEADRQALYDSLAHYPHVNQVRQTVSSDSLHTMYELVVEKSVNQKKLGKDIRNTYESIELVETSQDGATPPISVMIIAAVLIIGILLIMSQSWVEPFIYLATAGIAILINMGTNALLPSVSITTHSIASILQIVLSIDYCIVMTNRYRQELKIRSTKVEAASKAMKKAFAPIMSSATTTIVGLIMLCFMRLRIGMDMGIVLAKGVACSLICTFTLMPSLLILFQDVIERSHKKTFVIPTQRLGRFATSHKLPIAISAVLLFGLSFFFSQRTNIFFSANTESQIANFFPNPNPFIMVYNTEDEEGIIAFADSMRRDSSVTSIISYPTLLKQHYNAEEMTDYLSMMAIELGDMLPADIALSNMLNQEVMNIVYYMKSGEGDTLRLGFPQLVDFINNNCLDNPMFASVIDDSIRMQMDMLQEMTTNAPVKEKPELVAIVTEEQLLQATTDSLQATYASDAPAEEVTVSLRPITVVDEANPAPAPTMVQAATYSIVEYTNRLYADLPNALTMDFRTLVDTITLHRQLNINQMADYIGSSVTQTRLVFNYDPAKRKAMTPIEYMHILTDDLFNRKSLNGMINAEQKSLVRMRTAIMDMALKDAHLPAGHLATLTRRFGIEEISIADVERIMADPINRKPVASTTATPIDTALNTRPAVIESALAIAKNELPIDTISTNKKLTPASTISIKPQRRQTAAEKEADRKANLFLELMYGGKTYTSDQMANHFCQLGQPVDSAMISLLYTYYGSVNLLSDSMEMNIAELLEYISGPLLNDKRLQVFLDDDTREMIHDANSQMQQGVGMLKGEKHSLMALLTKLPTESETTYAFVDKMETFAQQLLPKGHYSVGESVMYSEMKHGFSHEMMIVTILTILAIFLIVAITFRSLVVPTILVMTVMTAVYVNVVFCGIVSGEMLYLAYLIVQSILMGATIDYGILFANYYKEKRKTLPANESIFEAYHGSIRTIMTSGLIMVIGPGAMALLTTNVMIRNIVGCLAIGALVAIILILVVLPGVLVVFDKWVVQDAAPKVAIHKKEQQ